VRHELLKRRQYLDDYRGVVHYLAEANVLAADRFCDSVEATLEMLASHPEMAPRAGFLESPETRLWSLHRFPNHLIFYRVDGHSVILLRLLHSARNLPALMPSE